VGAPRERHTDTLDVMESIRAAEGSRWIRDLVSFNEALLAKQCWRLLQSPESLMAKNLKAKYYHNSSFMDAKLGSKPSFVWRSIHGIRDILEAGLLWRVGNGQSINIWGDAWVPIPSTFKIHSPPKVLNPNSKVHELIDRERGEWDQTLLNTIFAP
jgi:hypothetical protein